MLIAATVLLLLLSVLTSVVWADQAGAATEISSARVQIASCVDAAREAEVLAIRALRQTRPNVVRAKYEIQRSIRLLKKADAVLNLCRVDGID